MNLTTIKNAAIGAVYKTKLGVQKRSPEILLGIGITSVVAGTIMACRATLKADKVLDDYKEKLDKVNKACTYENYSDDDYKKDVIIIKTQTGVEFVKLYGPSAGAIIGGISCILTSYGIMKKRNLALMAAYSAVQSAFDDYRKRVIEELGEEKDRMFRHGIKKEKIDVIDENGKKKKETVNTMPVPYPHSQYARIFDETNPFWYRNAEKNMTFITLQQSYANDLLNIRGCVFLNEVYDLLGFKRTQAGSVVGWKKSGDDSYIDFGIFNVNNPKARDFVNGDEYSVILDFNVDGVIWDLI